MTNGTDRHYAADEVVAPALIALKAWYDEARGMGTRAERPMAGFADLPALNTLPGVSDLALVELAGDGGYVCRAMGEGYGRIAALTPGTDGVIRETRPVIRQHFDLAVAERRSVHVSVTRWDGPKILQYDRLILPLTGDGPAATITHLLVGEVFLRLAKG
jgi:hypothetical protein